MLQEWSHELELTATKSDAERSSFGAPFQDEHLSSTCFQVFAWMLAAPSLQRRLPGLVPLEDIDRRPLGTVGLLELLQPCL